MIVKGEIGEQVFIKAEITAIHVSRGYGDNGIHTEYTLRLHDSDDLGYIYFKALSSDVLFEEADESEFDVCFEEPDEDEYPVPEDVEDATLPKDDEWSHPAPKKRGRPRNATVEDLVKRAKEEK